MQRVRAFGVPVLALLAAVIATGAALAQQPVPPSRARLTDTTGTLDAAARGALENKLAAFEQRKGAQIFVLMVPTTSPESLEQYSLRVAEAWQPGRGKIDDGLLLLIAKDDRRMRIEVGYGLEGAVPDALAKRIIAERIVPKFYQGDFAGGVNDGVDALIGLVDGEPLPAPEGVEQGPGAGPLSSLPVVLVFAIAFARLLRRALGTFGGALAAGAGAGLVVWLLTSVLYLGLGSGVVVFLLALVGLTGGAGRWASRGPWSGGLGGGGFGGGGFGGGGSLGGGGRVSRRRRGPVRRRRRFRRLVMKLLRHLLLPHSALDRRFSKVTLDAIEHAVAESETRHSAEIRVAIEATLDLAALRRVATPRDRALEVFGELHVWDTAQRNGVLIYVLLAERDVEIVADRGLDGRVGDTEWQRVCEGIEREFRDGRWREGALVGIAGVTEILAREFPATGANRNEQPDRPAIL